MYNSLAPKMLSHKTGGPDGAWGLVFNPTEFYVYSQIIMLGNNVGTVDYKGNRHPLLSRAYS